MQASKPIKAVILAAGRGSRMKELTEDIPKSLLTVGSRNIDDDTQISFLERHIDCLNRAGVYNIVVVVSYKKEKVISVLADRNVTIVENVQEDITGSGSLHSFQYAIDSDFRPLDGASHTILMDADIVYDQYVLDQFIHSFRSSSILISGRYQQDSEEVRIYGEDRRPAFIGKGLQPILVNGIPCLGEATGITHLSPVDHGLVKSITKWLVGDPKAEAGSLKRKGFGPAKQLTEHEELSQRLMLLFKMNVYILERDYLFSEVDTSEEYEYVRDVLYSKILSYDANYLARLNP